jgi:succinoglycan biosynthesis transport protein ExoP
MDQQVREAELTGSAGDGADLDGTAGEPERAGMREYAHILWRRKLVIIIVVVVAVGGVLAYCKIATKSYSASATVLLEPQISPLVSPSSASAANPLGSINVPNAIQVIESSSIQDIVSRTIPNPPSVSATESGLAGTTDVVNISASSSNPQVAASAANAYANAYITSEKALTTKTFTDAQKQLEGKINTVQLAISNLTNQIKGAAAGVNQTIDDVQLSNLEDQLTTLQNEQQQYQFYATQGLGTEVGQVISSASVPTSPSSPKTVEYTLLAFIFGLIAGLGLALLVNAVSTRE